MALKSWLVWESQPSAVLERAEWAVVGAKAGGRMAGCLVSHMKVLGVIFTKIVVVGGWVCCRTDSRETG